MTPLSVVIPHYGDPAPTRALVAQLLAMRDSGVQVIVADDCSPVPFPALDGVDVVRRAVNGGFGANVNAAAQVATGEAMLVLNSDLEIGPDFLAAMDRAARRHPGTVLSPRVVDSAGEEGWTGRRFPRVRHQTVAWLTPLARWRHTTAWHRAVGHDPRSRRREASVDWVIGAAMWIPLEHFRAVGGFDERFFMNSEEIDLQRRLRERGVRSVVLREPTVVHLGGGSSPSQVRRSWLVTGELTYADKWASRSRLQAGLAAATVVNLAVNSLRRACGRDVQPLATAREEWGLIRGHRNV